MLQGDPGPSSLALITVCSAGGKTTTIQDLITRYVKQGHRALDYRFYAGGRHEILNETGKDRVRGVGRWLSEILDS